MKQKRVVLKSLYSIKKVIKVYDTGDRPVLVQCDDLNDYVCKHGKGHKSCKNLFAEHLAYHCLQAFEIKLPTCALVEIKEHHILPTSECQPLFFKETGVLIIYSLSMSSIF
jgi:hypothetical protein